MITKRRMKKNQILEKTHFNPDPNIGLTKEQVSKKIENNEVNKVRDISAKSYTRIIFENTFTFFNILMGGIAACFIIFLGLKMILSMGFLVITACNLIIGIVQECKSKYTIEKLKLLNKEKYSVLRDGKVIELSSDEIVSEDILLLKQGSQIPADSKIINGFIEVNESLLTGESVPIKKNIGDSILGGSFVVSGSAKVSVEKIGTENYIYSIESKAKNFEKPKSKLMIGISGIIKKLTIIIIPLGLLTFWNQLVSSGNPTFEGFQEGIRTAGTAMIGMIPCGMMLLASMTMATGVIKLGKRETLIQDLYSVESLARVDALCFDKTGTLTDGTMTVVDVRFLDLDSELKEKIIPSYLFAFGEENQTSKALIKYFGKEQFYIATEKQPFSSSRKMSSAVINGTEYFLGAADYITKNKEILSIVNEKAENGLRVLAFAKSFLGRKDVLAIIIIQDTIRPEAKETMGYFRNNGVELRVISGDNINTVKYISKQCGIPNYEKAVDLSLVPEEELEHTIKKNYIFGRVSPEQKAKIVDVLHKEGKTVAITGDGVNDILAMKKSDCSIAMANGSPATKNVANVVLLDSNFASMPATVFEGRRIVNNIQRSSTLFLMKTFFMLFATFFSLILGIKLPIETSVMTLVSLLLTGISALLLSLEPSSTKISGDFTKNVLGKAIPAGFFLFLPMFILMVMGLVETRLNIPETNAYLATKVPVIAFTLAIAAFVVFFRISMPFNKYRAFLFGINLVIAILALVSLPEIFLNNSSEYLGKLIELHSGESNAIINIISDILENAFKFNIYKTVFEKNDWILIISFSIGSFLIYYLIDRIITKILKIKLFSNMLEVEEKE